MHGQSNGSPNSHRLRSASTQHRMQFGDDKIYSGSHLIDYDPSSWHSSDPAASSSSSSSLTSPSVNPVGLDHQHHHLGDASYLNNGHHHHHHQHHLQDSEDLYSDFASSIQPYSSTGSFLSHDGGLEMDIDPTSSSSALSDLHHSQASQPIHHSSISSSSSSLYNFESEQYQNGAPSHQHHRHQHQQQSQRLASSSSTSSLVDHAHSQSAENHTKGASHRALVAPPSSSSSASSASTTTKEEDDASPFDLTGNYSTSPSKSSSARARTRLQNRSSKVQSSHQPYPPTSTSSPTRSRSGSLKSGMPPSLQISTSQLQSNSGLSSPSLFPGGLPSPFRQPTTPNSATMDPTQSVRSSSPSSTSSVSGPAMSRVGSSSAASSVYGGEVTNAVANPIMGTSASSVSIYREPTAATSTPIGLSRTHSRRGSPSKAMPRNTRKLSDLDRRQICLFHEAHPNMKQDDIGAAFEVERSTVSKILKYKARWLAIVPPENESISESPESAPTPSASHIEGSMTTPHQSPPAPSTPHQKGHQSSGSMSSAPMSTSTSISGLFSGLTTSTPSTLNVSDASRVAPTRFVKIEPELISWARATVQLGRKLSDEALQTKAKEVAKEVARKHRGYEAFKASHSWLEGFKRRSGIAAGTFVDFLSPSSRSLPAADEREETDDVARSLDGEEDGEVEANDRSRKNKKRSSKRQSILSTRRQNAEHAASMSSSASSSPTKGLSASLSSATLSSTGTLKANKMDVDSRTPLRSAFASVASSSAGDTTLDSEATPTHSTIHSRATSASAAGVDQHAFDDAYAQSHFNTMNNGSTGSLDRSASYANISALGTPSRGSNGSFSSTQSLSINTYSPTDLNGSPYSYGYAQDNGSNPTLASSFTSSNSAEAYPLQSPFQAGSRHSSSQSLYSHGISAPLPGSGANSPVPAYHAHGRSGSTTSTASSFSGLTAFSSQNSLGTPLSGSLFGSFPHSQANSLPSTPAVGTTTNYYGHGPSGTQSQLQAAFTTMHQPSNSSSSSSSPQTVTPYQLQGGVVTETSPGRSGIGRRQTISGYTFNPAAQVDPTPPSRVQSQQMLNNVYTPAGAHAQQLAMSSSLSSTLGPAANVSAMQAFEGVVQACNWLNSQDARGFTQPSDLVAAYDLRSRLADRLGITLPVEEPSPTALSTSMSSSMSLPGSRGVTPSLSSSTTSNTSAVHSGGKFSFPASPIKPSRFKLGRTHSTSSIPNLSMNRRSHSGSISLFDASMAEESAYNQQQAQLTFQQ